MKKKIFKTLLSHFKLPKTPLVLPKQYSSKCSIPTEDIEIDEDQKPNKNQKNTKRLPPWLRKVIKKNNDPFRDINTTLKDLKLSTVCEEAKCPNIGECWGEFATATIMVMGDICTRACSFCAVECNNNPPPLDPEEPHNVATAIAEWKLEYIVMTTVSRDDVPDSGAQHLCDCVAMIKKKNPHVLVELLANDFLGVLEDVETVVNSEISVFAHNLETVESLQDTVRDRRASYEQSLRVLEYAKSVRSDIITKTSLMLGLGESDEEVRKVLRDLRKIDCDVVTFGQYLQPSKANISVVEYVHPTKFEEWQKEAEDMGFLYVASGPLVRSSYRAAEFYLKNKIKEREKDKQKTEIYGI